jgi:hypothetical protein
MAKFRQEGGGKATSTTSVAADTSPVAADTTSAKTAAYVAYISGSAEATSMYKQILNNLQWQMDNAGADSEEMRQVLQAQIDEIRMQLEPPAEAVEALSSALRARHEPKAITADGVRAIREELRKSTENTDPPHEDVEMYNQLQAQIDEILARWDEPVEVETLRSVIERQREQEKVTLYRHFEDDKEREEAIKEEAERLFDEMRLSPGKEKSIAETFEKDAKNRKDLAKLLAPGNERENEAEVLRQLKDRGQVVVKVASTASNVFTITLFAATASPVALGALGMMAPLALAVTPAGAVLACIGLANVAFGLAYNLDMKKKKWGVELGTTVLGHVKKWAVTEVKDWRKRRLREMGAKDTGLYSRIKYQLLLQAEIDELTTARNLYHARADDILRETEVASRYYHKVREAVDEVGRAMTELSKRMASENVRLEPEAAVELAARCRRLDALWAQLRRFYEEHIGGEHEDLEKHGLQEDLEKRGFPTLKEIYKRLAELKQEMANIDDRAWFEKHFDEAVKEGAPTADQGAGGDKRVRAAQVLELASDFLLNVADGTASGLAGLTDDNELTVAASVVQYVVTGMSCLSNIFESAGKAKTICNSDVELYHQESAGLLGLMTGAVSDLVTRYHKWQMEKGSEDSKETWVRRIRDEIEQEEARLDKLRGKKSAVAEILSAYKSHADQQLSVAKERIVTAMDNIWKKKFVNATELVKRLEGELEAARKAWAELTEIVAKELEKGDEFLKPQEDKIEELRKLLREAEGAASG